MNCEPGYSIQEINYQRPFQHIIQNEEALIKNYSFKKPILEGYLSPNNLCLLMSEGFPSLEMLVFRYTPTKQKTEWSQYYDHHLMICMPHTTLKYFEPNITTAGSGDTYSKGVHIKIASDTAKPGYVSLIPADVKYDGRCELRPVENPEELDYEDNIYDDECLTLYIRCKFIDAAAIRYAGKTCGKYIEL